MRRKAPELSTQTGGLQQLMMNLSREIQLELDAARPFVLATIISHKGSTPRTSGSRMLVREDKTIAGTIGGGLVEANVMDACMEMLDTSRTRIMDFSLDQEAKAGMDMICGGSLTVWLRSFVPPFSADLFTAFRLMADFGAQGVKAFAVTRICGETTQVPMVVTPGEAASGPSLLPKDLLCDIDDNKFTGPGLYQMVYGLEQFIIEPFAPRQTLYIFGAGHVGYQLGQMAHMTDFSLVVIDDRAQFADPLRFPHARQVLVIENFESAFAGLDVDENGYIVILTRGHLHDQTVLEQALETPAAYIGMIGSRKKRDRIYSNLMDNGIARERLDAVHSPIGTDIDAQTPAEIAVSIMAELILERAKKRERRATDPGRCRSSKEGQ